MVDMKNVECLMSNVQLNEGIKIKVADLNISYGKVESVRNLSIDIKKNEIVGIIGPANSGKTSFLKTLNRLNDFVNSCKISGQILLDGNDIFADIDVHEL